MMKNSQNREVFYWFQYNKLKNNNIILSQSLERWNDEFIFKLNRDAET